MSLVLCPWWLAFTQKQSTKTKVPIPPAYYALEIIDPICVNYCRHGLPVQEISR
jgi:hypothetical protein